LLLSRSSLDECCAALRARRRQKSLISIKERGGGKRADWLER
jgi:hypothetical protein